MSNIKIAAVVILYNPQPSIVPYIRTYLDTIECLYIIDNSITPSNILHKLKSNKITIIHKGRNLGIAKALNLALIKAKDDGFKWLFTFDQDSFFNKGDCQTFITRGLLNVSNKVAILSPLHNKKFKDIIKKDLIDVNIVMTSGNLVNIDIALSVGGFDEKLFIDEVDHEFSFRLKIKGYRILLDTHIALNHSLGTPHNTFSQIKIYSNDRIYYMLRNYLYIKNKYKDFFKDFFKKRDFYLLKFLIKQLLFGTHRIQKIRYIKKAIQDYMHMNFGQLK